MPWGVGGAQMGSLPPATSHGLWPSLPPTWGTQGFIPGGPHLAPIPGPSQYCLGGGGVAKPSNPHPPSAFALFLYPELEVYFLIYII